MPLSLEQKEFIEREAISWIGTPYQHRQRVKGVGVDCGQLIWAVFEPILGPFGQIPKYESDWSLHRTDQIFIEFIKPYVVEVERPEWCDVVLWHVGRSYCHAALMLKNRKFIHAYGMRCEGGVQVNGSQFFTLPGGQRPLRKFKAYRVK